MSEEAPPDKETPPSEKTAILGDDFRLIPGIADTLLKRWYWITLITLGPLLALVIESALISLIYWEGDFRQINWYYVVSDLRDYVFVSASFTFLFGGLAYAWFWRSRIYPTFQSLQDEGNISGPNDKKSFRERLEDCKQRLAKKRRFLPVVLLINVILLFPRDSLSGKDVSLEEYLEDYKQRLASRKRFIPAVLFVGAALLFSHIIFSGRDISFTEILEQPGNSVVNLLLALHLATRWVIAPVLWISLSGIGLWAFWVTMRAVQRLPSKFTFKVWPNHPDRAGGLVELGEISFRAGAIFLIAAIPFALSGVFGLTRISDSIAYSDYCVNEIQATAAEGERGSKNALQDCMVAVLDYDIRDAEAEIQDLLNGGMSPEEIVQRYADEFEAARGELPETIKEQLSWLVSMTGIFIGMAFIAALVMLVPQLGVHGKMKEQRDLYKQLIHERVIRLDEMLKQHIDNQEWESAETVRGQLAAAQQLYPEAIHYPTWPFPSKRLREFFVRTLLIPAFVVLIQLIPIFVSGIAGELLQKFLDSAIPGAFGG